MSTTLLREWRRRTGLSLADAAGLTGISQAHLSRIETGKRNPPPLTKVAIARRLGVPVDEIFPVEVLVFNCTESKENRRARQD